MGRLLISLLRHSDRVGVASPGPAGQRHRADDDRAAGPAWRQTIFHPFAITSRLAQGVVLRVEPHSDTYHTARHGDVPLLDAVATYDPASGDVTVFTVNRSTEDTLTLTTALAAFGEVDIAESWVIGGGDPYAINERDQPDRVVPVPLESVQLVDGSLQAELPPVSWCAVRLTTTAAHT